MWDAVESRRQMAEGRQQSVDGKQHTTMKTFFHPPFPGLTEGLVTDN